jgi:hypothetical protein
MPFKTRIEDSNIFNLRHKEFDRKLDSRLDNKWPKKSIDIAKEPYDIKENIGLYDNDKYSNHWNLRELLLTESLDNEKIKQSIFMRYGGKELAKKT